MTCFLRHDWSKWSDVVQDFGGKVQWRICKNCNRVDRVLVSYGNGVDAQQINETIKTTKS